MEELSLTLPLSPFLCSIRWGYITITKVTTTFKNVKLSLKTKDIHHSCGSTDVGRKKDMQYSHMTMLAITL